MKKEKSQQVPGRVLRQVAVLSKYYEVDAVNKSIIIELQYDKASDLFENDLVVIKTPKFKNEILARISDIFDTIPSDFKVNFKLKVNDYEGYDPDEITDSFNDSLETFHYSVHREKSFRWIEALILALISVTILTIRLFASNMQFVSQNEIINEMLDIVAWVFLWEAVSVLFLTPDEYKSISFKLVKRLSSFTLLDKNDKVAQTRDQNEIVEGWISISKLENTYRKLLVVVAGVTIASGVTSLFNTIEILLKITNETLASSLITASIGGLTCLTTLLGGIAAVEVFLERGKIRKIMPLISYIFLFYSLTVLGISIFYVANSKLEFGALVSTIISAIILSLNGIFYFACYVLRKVVKKNKKKSI